MEFSPDLEWFVANGKRYVVGVWGVVLGKIAHK